MRFQFQGKIRALNKSGRRQYVITVPLAHMEEFKPPVDKLMDFLVEWRTASEKTYSRVFRTRVS
jgi:hypothetical protein